MIDSVNKRPPIDKARAANPSAGMSHLLGMGMGMGPGEGAHPYRSPTHIIYGESLIDRHEWSHTVFLVEFLTNTDWKKKIRVEEPRDDQDEQTLSELKKLRSKQDHEHRRERSYEIIAEVHDYVGLYENLCYFDAHTHPITSSLVQTVDLIGWTVVQYYKERFGRTRPSYLDPAIRPVIRVPAHPAYPSGHSTQAHLIRNALEDVLDFRDDDFRVALSELAQRIAENREWAGVHYESDTLAGKKLALDIWHLAKSNQNFEKFIAEAKDEWTSSRAFPSRYQLLDH